jgi:hypothetical protein
MSDCPNPRHLLIPRLEVLKARIGSAFSKMPEWGDVITRLLLPG